MTESQTPWYRGFPQELHEYAEAFRFHRRLVLSIGLYFGWLLSFPMLGPLMGKLVESNSLDPTPLMLSLLTGHFTGLAAAGAAGYVFKKALAWFSLSAVPCAGLSLLLTGAPPAAWLPALFALMGLFAAPAVISWTNAFAHSVEPAQRGRTFAMGAVVANVIQQLMTGLLDSAGIGLLIAIAGSLSLAMPVLLVRWYRRTGQAPDAPPAAGEAALQKAYQFWPVVVFIFIINTSGGLMYVFTAGSTSGISLVDVLRVLPYILLLFVAGTLADIRGRRLNAIVGAITVGAGFMSIGLFTGPVQYVAIQTLMVGGFAFLDVFIWAITADLSEGRWAPVLYAVFLVS